MKAYAIELNAEETIIKVKELQQLIESTKAVGVHPAYPFAYVMFRTHEAQINGYKEFKKVFDHCKAVKNVAEIPDC